MATTITYQAGQFIRMKNDQTVTVRLPRAAVQKIRRVLDNENGGSVGQWCRAKILRALHRIKE